jgi:TPR repeat protein
VSASWAYKTSEFNLGVMYARGEGVPVDLPRAMAWMTLAAERGDRQYVQARDLIAAQLDKSGLARAEEILREILPTYGDAVALGRAKQRWHEVRDQATGSHLGFTGDVTVATGGGNGAVGKPQGTPMEQYQMTKFTNTGRAQPASKLPPPGQSNTGAQGSADLTGTAGVDGSTAYSDLHLTDNPYDPRLSRGTATVGAPTTVVDRKKGADDANAAQPATDPRQRQ